MASFGLGISIFATNVEILYVTLGLVTGELVRKTIEMENVEIT